MIASKGILDAGSAQNVSRGISLAVQKEIASMDLGEFPFEVLSDIYESYLAESGQRKGKGVYYTPPYIVRYIVDRTLGKYLWGTESGRSEGNTPAKTPEDVRDLRILDPACGSGSFLAYTFDVLAEFYVSHDSCARIDWLSVILENHLYGIDLDSDAVDITSAILTLKASEHVGRTLDKTPKLNISQGDFLTGEMSEALDSERFTMILGNPPYGARLTKAEREQIKTHYETYRSSDSSSLFIEKAVKILSDKGLLGFIIPKSLSYVVSWCPIRKFLLSTCRILEIADVRKAFKDVLLEQMVITAQKNGVPDTKTLVSILEPERSVAAHSIDNAALTGKRFSIWLNSHKVKNIVDRIWETSVPLGRLAEIWSGLNVQKQAAFSSTQDSEHNCPCLRGRNIQRYYIRPGVQYAKTADITSALDAFRRPKIIAQDIVAHIKNPIPHIKLTATIDKSGDWINLNTVTNIASSEYHLEYLCGLLNSRLISWYAYDFIYNRAIRTMHFRRGYADHIPICRIDQENPMYKQLIEYVSRMIALHHEQTVVESEIAELDREINQLIYKLYRLTDADIRFLKARAGF